MIFFSKSTPSEKKNQEYHQCQTVWIQIRPDVLSGFVGPDPSPNCLQRNTTLQFINPTESVQEIFALISPNVNLIILNAQLFSRAKSPFFDLSLFIHTYVVCVRSEGSGAQVRLSLRYS